ncbi:DUF3277 domain-containing protein [Enterobacteriaceae bacterium ESL0689]|nr:DUF3277 domain-containing protein [Enterobacteriaceae bacterium ESL0689]
MHRSTLSLNGYEITAWDESSDSFSLAPVGDDGAYTIGAGGRGVFVFTGNESGILTFKLLQHSADNKFLCDLRNQILNSQSAPTPIEMYFKDTWNGDELVGQAGFLPRRRPMPVVLRITPTPGLSSSNVLLPD